MANKTAIALLQNFVRENLEIGWSHLEDGRFAMAKHHIARALEQVNEIETLHSPTPEPDPQPKLIDL